MKESGSTFVKSRYAFIKVRSSHTVVEQIIKILEHTFPSYDLDIIDIKKLLKRNLPVIVINIFHVIVIYGVKTIFEDKSIIYNRFFGTPYMYHAIRRLLKKEVEGKGYIFTFQDCSLFNGKIDHIPNFVYTDHTVLENRGYPDYLESRDLLSKKWIVLEREIYQNSDAVFTRYKKIALSLINEYSCKEENVKNIYYSPNIRQIQLNREKYFSKNILFIGIDWSRKGGKQLISAFSKVLEKVPTAKLTIIGCNPKITLNNVQIVGKVSNDNLANYYDNAAVFCMPTRKEHAGIVFTEAMGYALPVVGTRVGAIPEYIQDGKNGYLVDVDDVDGLAEKLTQLISDPIKCLEFGNHSYDIYKQLFSFVGITNQIRNTILEKIRQ